MDLPHGVGSRLHKLPGGVTQVVAIDTVAIGTTAGVVAHLSRVAIHAVVRIIVKVCHLPEEP